METTGFMLTEKGQALTIPREGEALCLAIFMINSNRQNK